MLSSRLLTVVLLLTLAASSTVLAYRLKKYSLPGNQQGYEPIQPIAFSHRQHAGDLQIACVYCHAGTERSRHAGFPAASLCMNCHRLVTASPDALLQELQQARQAKRPPQPVISPELAKLYDALGLDGKMQPDPAKKPRPIEWVKVHNLPDFACFDHRPHVHAGVECQQCHGPVQSMERVRQVEDLSMGWCVNCHRKTGGAGVAGKKVKPSTDCAACHYGSRQ
jgi:hypothetical protein